MYVDSEDDGDGAAADHDIESVTLRLADVAGMAEVKARLDAAILAPMRNPELTRLYDKSLQGRAAALRPAGLRQDVHLACARR